MEGAFEVPLARPKENAAAAPLLVMVAPVVAFFEKARDVPLVIVTGALSVMVAPLTDVTIG